MHTFEFYTRTSEGRFIRFKLRARNKQEALEKGTAKARKLCGPYETFWPHVALVIL